MGAFSNKKYKAAKAAGSFCLKTAFLTIPVIDKCVKLCNNKFRRRNYLTGLYRSEIKELNEDQFLSQIENLAFEA